MLHLDLHILRLTKQNLQDLYTKEQNQTNFLQKLKLKAYACETLS